MVAHAPHYAALLACALLASTAGALPGVAWDPCCDGGAVCLDAACQCERCDATAKWHVASYHQIDAYWACAADCPPHSAPAPRTLYLKPSPRPPEIGDLLT